MLKRNMHIVLFFMFAMGLPLWAMENNAFQQGRVHGCIDDCYSSWKDATGGVLAVAAAKAEAKATASPEELGEMAYAGCIACHGAKGNGGIGPKLVGQSSEEIYEKLVQYKNGETRGSQSALMWGQAAILSEQDMGNIAAFVEALQ